MSADRSELHWCEGLFLQPHHFQYHQRAIEARSDAERSLSLPYDYGLIDCEIFEEGLANKVVRFDRLSAVMPAGQYLRLGENTELDQLDISAEFDRSSGPLMIWLALPVWSKDASNIIDESSETSRREPRQFKTARRDWRDENTGDNVQELTIRRYNARLVAGPKPPNNFTALPMLKLIRGTGQKQGQPIVDPSFIPTLLLMRGWKPAIAMVEELAVEAETNREVSARLMKTTGYHPDRVQPAHLLQLIRLMLLGRYSVRLGTMIKTPGCRPADVFVELRGFLAELEGMRPDMDRTPNPEFDHDAPGPALAELYLRIRQLLAGSVSVRYREAAFTLKDRVLIAPLEKVELTEPCEFMLAIDSPFDSKEVADFIEDRTRFKVMSPSTAYAAFPGVKVIEERAPIGLPVRDKRHFFRLYANADAQSTDMWKKIAAENVIVLNWRELEQHLAKKALLPTLFVVRSGERPQQ